MSNEKIATETVVNYPSANGADTVTGYFYADPAASPKAVIQLSHGMTEYIPRYRPLAEFLVSNGFAVCGNDHIGHGATCGDTGIPGWFAEENGGECAVEDLHTMTLLAKQKYPGLPVFLLGHSMGSFFARWYAEKYGSELTGLILVGTAGPNPAAKIGIALADFLILFKSSVGYSNFLEKMAFGKYLARIPEPKTAKDWLTHDEEMLNAYLADPHCGFRFTLGGLKVLTQALVHVNRRQWPHTLPQSLPIWLACGDEDPVGDYGKGVKKVYYALQKAGIKQVTLTVYPGCRHEPHTELAPIRDRMYRDLVRWLESHLT